MADRSENERLQRLEQDVNQRVREAFTGLREQIGQRLRRLSDEALEALEGLGEAELPTVLGAADLEPLARDTEGAAGHAAGELVAALSALDRARGQGEVLSALAREARRFAARTAVLLTRESIAELWSAEGWDEAPEELHFEYPPADGWAPATFGRSAVELAGDARGELARRFGAEAPERALLVPLVLRDRLAAVLYADDIDRPFPLGASLQVLTWAASQALESLPFRQREATATLAGLGGDEPASEAPALWGSPAAGEESHGGGRAVGLAAAGLAAAGLAAAGVAKVRHDRREEAAGFDQAVDEAEPMDEAGTAAQPDPALADFEDVVLEEGPGPEIAAPPVSLDDDLADGSEALEEAEPAGTAWSYEEVEEPPPADAEEVEEPEEPEEADEPEAPASFGLDVAESEPPAATPGFASEPEVAARTEPEAPPLEPEEETHPATMPIQRADQLPATTVPGVAPLPPEAADETYPGFGGVMPSPEAPPVAPPRPPAGGAGAEVAPPPDLEGPGRAFAGRAAAPDENQARHDEARRLARLLVSEIRLYNEDEVEAGRRHGDIYERLKEDIDRSRQMYEERVDAGVREGTDYFYQELVRNLGGGDARVLGI